MPIKCAIYARYSAIDELTKDGSSRSISNQIKTLTEYANSNNYIIYDIYTDYHISGKNLDRPGMNKLLRDAENKEFEIVLVKDLSRFGRNYLEVGKYIDNIFPELGIRFISIGDNFDSDNYNDTLPIAIRNFMNDYYLKDIGRKIRRAFANKMKKEPCVSRRYGYLIKDKDITIYEPEASIVRRIFKLYLDGMKAHEIAKLLSKEKVLSPYVSFYIKYPNKERLNNIKDKYKWKLETIKSILTDVFYIGDAISNKSGESKSIDTKNIYFKDHHVAIIKREDFNKINERDMKNKNMDARNNNLTRMIYCVKCICKSKYDKSKACLSPILKDGKEYYMDYKCNKSYPADLMNKRIYQELILKYQYILNNKESYINDLLISINSSNGDAINISNEKKKCEKKLQAIFEDYVNLKINSDNYQSQTKDLRKQIVKYENYLKAMQFDESSISDVNIKVNKFLNEFYESNNIVEVIKKNCEIILYDERFGKFIIIFKFEAELNKGVKTIKDIITPYKLKNADFELREIILEYLKNNPHKKLNDILKEALNTWDGFTYQMIKKKIQELEHEGLVEIEGRSYLCDTYHLVGTEDDFDYKGMKICRKTKEVYKLLYNDQTLSYKDIAEKLDISESMARTHVIELRKQNAFDDPHFDKSITQDGSNQSIFIDYNMTEEAEKEIIEYINNNPGISRYKLSKLFNIREGSARRLLNKYRINKPKLIHQIQNVETGEIYDSVLEAAKSVNGFPANIISATRNPNHTAYGYHWIDLRNNKDN